MTALALYRQFVVIGGTWWFVASSLEVLENFTQSTEITHFLQQLSTLASRSHENFLASVSLMPRYISVTPWHLSALFVCLHDFGPSVVLTVSVAKSACVSTVVGAVASHL